MIRHARGTLVLLLISVASQPVPADDEFPIVGTYLRDMVCSGDGSQRPDLLVRITPRQVESQMGVCNILSRKSVGKTISLHLQCKLPGDQLILGDVTFTIRDAKTVDFADEDHTSDATLHRCEK